MSSSNPSPALTPKPIAVKLNVYDICLKGICFNNRLFGLYHTGLQIGSNEYAFGRAKTGTGIWMQYPKIPPSYCKFRETIDMGVSFLTSAEIEFILDQLRVEYLGTTYDTLRKNCNHFTDDLLQRICGQRIPAWINKSAKLGQSVTRNDSTHSSSILASSVPLAPSGSTLVVHNRAKVISAPFSQVLASARSSDGRPSVSPSYFVARRRAVSPDLPPATPPPHQPTVHSPLHINEHVEPVMSAPPVLLQLTLDQSDDENGSPQPPFHSPQIWRAQRRTAHDTDSISDDPLHQNDDSELEGDIPKTPPPIPVLTFVLPQEENKLNDSVHDSLNDTIGGTDEDLQVHPSLNDSLSNQIPFSSPFDQPFDDHHSPGLGDTMNVSFDHPPLEETVIEPHDVATRLLWTQALPNSTQPQ
ncbi:putative Desumoylating isopeptidase 2 [Blattamonas nauphoetae]|uniref:Desumoylating isopeptidase 2 n=1 Tax=Blattamonas nauphoetae TaxID=2049346 RepID=A0ABQ9XZK5_9EUKA|nr:putative Desumoylating isopeptidase 2 [Blattamonas nauphoetae]